MNPASTWDYVYALLGPTLIAAMCTSALRRSVKHARWLVPVLLASKMLSVVDHPHVPTLTTVALAAGLLAMVACLLGHNRHALAATLVSCAALAATLFAGLLGQQCS